MWHVFLPTGGGNSTFATQQLTTHDVGQYQHI
jgi:hypothetical protein